MKFSSAQNLPYLEGCSPSQLEELNVPPVEFTVINRPIGYSLPHYISLSSRLSIDSETVVEGFGDGTVELARAKSLSELIERLTMIRYARKVGKADSSNGWACHVDAFSAFQNAKFELIERHVAISAWSNGRQYMVLPVDMFPASVKVWHSVKSKLEFSNLVVAFSSHDQLGCISAFLFNEKNNFVVGHASGADLYKTVESAVNEALRAAHLAIRFEFYNDVRKLHDLQFSGSVQPGAHSLAYAYAHGESVQLRFFQTSEREIETKWALHRNAAECLTSSDFEVLNFSLGDHSIIRLRHQCLAQPFWGRPASALNIKNYYPHIVG